MEEEPNQEAAEGRDTGEGIGRYRIDVGVSEQL